MKEDIDKLIKSVFQKELPKPTKVPNEDEPEVTIHRDTGESVVWEQMLETVSKEIPDPITGPDREDFITLLHVTALLLGAFVCLDAAFDPAKKTTEERRQGCLSSGERLASEGAKTLEKMKRHFFKCSTPDANGNVHVEIHRQEPKKEEGK